jgi:hypothetical protein
MTTPKDADLGSLALTGAEQDHIEFREISVAAREAWIRDRFPSGAPAAWWFFVVEGAETDLNIFRDASMEQRQASTRFVVDAVELAVALRCIPASCGVSMLSRLAKAASLIDEMGNLPAAIGADALARRALEAMPVSETAALAAADRRRREAVEDPDAWCSPRVALAEQILPPDEDIMMLSEIEQMLSSLEWLADRVTPGADADELRRWLLLRDRFDLGAAAVEVGRRRWPH